MLNITPYLNPWDIDPADSTDERGVPFFLSKKTPAPGRTLPAKRSKEKTNQSFSMASPQVFEEIATSRNPSVKPKKASKPENNDPTETADFVNGFDVLSESINDQSPDPMEQVRQEYYDQLQKRSKRQAELDEDYDTLKAQGRPSGFSTLDLSPAFSFVDHLTGSKLASSYKAPTVAKEYDAKLAAAQEVALLNSDKLTADQLGALSFDQKGDQFTESQNRQDARLDKQLKNAMEIAKIKAENGGYINPLALAQFQYKMARDAEVDSQKLSKVAADSSRVMTSINKLDQLLDPSKELGAREGVGIGGRIVPNFALSDRGEDIRQNAMNLANQYRLLMTGQASSAAEDARLLETLGMGVGSTERQFRNGYDMLRRDTISLLQAQQSGFRPQVQDIYRDRGGSLVEDYRKKGSAPSPEDKAALDWLKNNPTSPDRFGVEAKLREKGLL